MELIIIESFLIKFPLDASDIHHKAPLQKFKTC